MQIIEKTPLATLYLDNGFTIREINNKYKSVIISSKSVEETKKYMLKNKIEGVEINRAFGFKGELEFLKELEFVKYLSILDSNIKNITPICSLRKLKYLHIAHENDFQIDLSPFSSLECCKIFWNRNISNLSLCTTLKYLSLYKYQKEDLSEISTLRNIENLCINTSPLISLKELESLKKLRSLSLEYLNKYELFDCPTEIAEKLEYLELYSCRKIFSLDFASNMTHLRTLKISNCGDIKSLEPIKLLSKIEELMFGGSTNILDGDLSPCLSIKRVGFKNRRHYNFSKNIYGQWMKKN